MLRLPRLILPVGVGVGKMGGWLGSGGRKGGVWGGMGLGVPVVGKVGVWVRDVASPSAAGPCRRGALGCCSGGFDFGLLLAKLIGCVCPAANACRCTAQCWQPCKLVAARAALRCRRVAKATGATVVMTLADMEGNETFDAANLGQAEEVGLGRGVPAVSRVVSVQSPLRAAAGWRARVLVGLLAVVACSRLEDGPGRPAGLV